MRDYAVNITFYRRETTQAKNDLAAATSRHDDRGILIFVMSSLRRRAAFEPWLRHGGSCPSWAGFGAVHKLHGASRTRCGGEFEAPSSCVGGTGTISWPPAAVPIPVSSPLTTSESFRSSRPYLVDRLSAPSLMHFAGVANTTLQRCGQCKEVPGTGSNARTSSFNLSYHHKPPGPPPVRPLQPSDSNCCMSPGRLIWPSGGLRMRQQKRYSD